MKRLFYKMIFPIQTFYYFVFRPKTYGVKCLIVYEGKVLLIQNTYVKKKWWTLPGGGISKNENPDHAAMREVREEVGIDLSRVRYLGKYESRRQYKRDTVFCYQAEVESPEFKIDSGEISQASWFPIHDLPHPLSFAVTKTLEMLSSQTD